MDYGSQSPNNSFDAWRHGTRLRPQNVRYAKLQWIRYFRAAKHQVSTNGRIHIIFSGEGD